MRRRMSSWTGRRPVKTDLDCPALIYSQARVLSFIPHSSAARQTARLASRFNPPDARPEESALDRHDATGLERAAALYVLRRTVRAFFQHRRTRSRARRAVSRRDELDPYRHHHARPL